MVRTTYIIYSYHTQKKDVGHHSENDCRFGSLEESPDRAVLFDKYCSVDAGVYQWIVHVLFSELHIMVGLVAFSKSIIQTI